MQGTLVEQDNERPGRDPEYPVDLSVQVGPDPRYPFVLRIKTGSHSERFETIYRLKLTGTKRSLRVNGECEALQFNSPSSDTDEETHRYMVGGLRRSVPAVRDYLQRQFPGASITGEIVNDPGRGSPYSKETFHL